MGCGASSPKVTPLTDVAGAPSASESCQAPGRVVAFTKQELQATTLGAPGTIRTDQSRLQSRRMSDPEVTTQQAMQLQQREGAAEGLKRSVSDWGPHRKAALEGDGWGGLDALGGDGSSPSRAKTPAAPGDRRAKRLGLRQSRGSALRAHLAQPPGNGVGGTGDSKDRETTVFLIQVLSSLPLFSSLSIPSLHRAAEMMRCAKLSKGDVLVSKVGTSPSASHKATPRVPPLAPHPPLPPSPHSSFSPRANDDDAPLRILASVRRRGRRATGCTSCRRGP